MYKTSLLAALLFAVACRQPSPAVCQLTAEDLLSKQRISMQLMMLGTDTLDISSNDVLCWSPLGVGDSLPHLPIFYRQPRQVFIYRLQKNGLHFTDSTGNILVTTDTTNLAFCTPIRNKNLSKIPQGILNFSITNNRIILAEGIRVGLPKLDFINLLFKNLTQEETACLLQRKVFKLGDPLGEYISHTYEFTNDKLSKIVLQSPGTFANAQRL